MTENSFIDHYARQVEHVDIAVYHALERHMNCHTRSTWVGTAKLAELLNTSQRTVQRSLKRLEELKLIRILKNANMTIYVIPPVPQRPKMAATPLFDGIPDDEILDQVLGGGDNNVASTTFTTPGTTFQSRKASIVTRVGDIYDAPNKEEQDLLNNTLEQDQSGPVTPRGLANKVVAILGLPASDNNLRMVQAALIADEAYTGQSLQEVAERITQSAMEDRKSGVAINKFYFEDARWRQDRRSSSKYGTNKAEQRKLDNLEANARFKERLRERLRHS
jgi:hypothetical protein